MLVKLQNTKRRLCINEDQKVLNAVVLLPVTIKVHWSFSLLFASKDGGDGNGLKLEKTGQFFQIFLTMSSESRQKLKMNSFKLCYKFISYLVSELSGILYMWTKLLIQSFTQFWFVIHIVSCKHLNEFNDSYNFVINRLSVGTAENVSLW